jgi:group I intron endonuclease
MYFVNKNMEERFINLVVFCTYTYLYKNDIDMRKEKKFHFIYKTTCTITGKYYIGLHSTDNLEDGYLGSGRRIKYSLNKYGKENHIREIVEFCETRKDVIKREAEIVNIDELTNENCINIKLGGGENAMYGKFMDDEHKLKIGLANGGEKNGMFGKRFDMSDERKNNIKNALLSSNKLKESRNSEEYKEKISRHFGKTIYVLDVNLNVIETFNSMTKATEFFKCKESNIFNARRDKRMIKRKYWVVYPEDYEDFKKERL